MTALGRGCFLTTLKTSPADSAELWVSVFLFHPPLSLPEGAAIGPVSQTEELRLREAKPLPQDPTWSTWRSRVLLQAVWVWTQTPSELLYLKAESL